MSSKFNYCIRLVKDAEPGTGLGGQTVNDFVPRDAEGWPVIPASHVKGLMRAALKEIAQPRTKWCESLEGDEQKWPRQLLDRVFGGYNQQGSEGESVLRFTDAVIEREEQPNARADERDDWVETRRISRTAIDVGGVADQHTLRTTEAIPKDTQFHGVIFCEADPDSVEALAARLSLLGVTAVGGSRNRGGQCVAEIVTEEKVASGESPGQLLKDLDAAISEQRFASRRVATTTPLAAIKQPATTNTVVELLFIADSPICCPERADKSNVVSSGFSIPASAVQGVVLNHINRHNPELATSLFNNKSFRCWPLNPCGNTNAPDVRQALHHLRGENAPQLFDELPLSVRVSLSHRVAKYSLSETYTKDYFCDRSFAKRNGNFRWPESPEGAPLKGADGVLLHGGELLECQPALWKASHMPRKITTHGVLDGPREHAGTRSNGRNLFTVDAMAPLIWRGMVAVPEDVADALIESFTANPEVSIGKARSVRGLGRLVARRMPEGSTFWNNEQDSDLTVLVLQSPALIPDATATEIAGGKSGEHVLASIASQWLAHHGLPGLAKEPACWANVGIRFGWNRHGADGKGSRLGFQKAETVFLPGTVFALEGKADSDKLRKAILDGFRDVSDFDDSERTKGFGALAVHPGQANDLYRADRKPRRMRTTEMRRAMEIVLDCQGLAHLPSPSQIRAVEQRIQDTSDIAKAKASVAEAKEYLDRQCGRIIKIWYDWELTYDYVVQLLNECEPASAKMALKSLSEISIARREDKQ